MVSAMFVPGAMIVGTLAARLVRERGGHRGITFRDHYAG
jgi:hypothetical protein